MTERQPSNFVLNRRVFLGGVAAGTGLALAGPAAAIGVPHSDFRQMAFDIRRDGATIGRHEVGFRQSGDRLEVDVSIEISISLAFIPVFSYSHRNHEIWQDSRLVALDSETDDDGERYAVTARSQPSGLRVIGAEGDFVAPAGIIPTSYWNPLTTKQQRLLDSQHGRLLAVNPIFVEAETLAGGLLARRYRLSGDLDLDLWYSGEGEWVKIAFEARGAEVSYARRAVKPAGGSTG